MGTVHKFKRPPKNQGQFQGYRPGTPLPARGRKGPRLRDWHKTVLAWAALILVAVAIWGLGKLF